MLRGEGNENSERTTTALINKIATLHSSTLFCTFLCRCFAQLQCETSRNFLVTRFMEEITYVFLFTFFLLSLIFTLVASTISHFLTADTKFLCCSSKKKMYPLFFICYSSSLSLSVFSLSFAGLSPTLSFSLSLFQICGHDKSKHNTLDNTDTETISTFRFRLY